MPTVVGVILRNAPSAVLIDPADVLTKIDDVVVVESDRGTELGRVAVVEREREPGDNVSADRLVRVATEADLETAKELHAREREAMQVYRRLVAKHKLEMKPTEVEYLFDGSKAVFYFVAEDRVDFRDLVRDLAAEFHVRIDMRQIGVRDEARMVGGLGHCGEQLCCVRFGGEFQPVSIRMAKEQDLPLNPLKISGLCGRLMCCLRYEYEAYKDFKGRAPKKGAIVDIGGTLGKVVELDTPRERVTMRKEDGSRVTFGLEDMECCKGQGCPCSVKAEAIERSIQNQIELPATMVQPRERKLTESAAARDAVVAPSSTDAPESASGTGRRRRRRGGESGAGESTERAKSPKGAKAAKGSGDAAKDAGEAKAAKPSRRRRGGKNSAKSGAQPGVAPATDASAASGGEGASPARRRRRRRRGSGSGEGSAPAGE